MLQKMLLTLGQLASVVSGLVAVVAAILNLWKKVAALIHTSTS